MSKSKANLSPSKYLPRGNPMPATKKQLLDAMIDQVFASAFVLHTIDEGNTSLSGMPGIELTDAQTAKLVEARDLLNAILCE